MSASANPEEGTHRRMNEPDLTPAQRTLNVEIWCLLGSAVKLHKAEWDDVIYVLKRSIDIAESNKEIGLYRPELGQN